MKVEIISCMENSKVSDQSRNEETSLSHSGFGIFSLLSYILGFLTIMLSYIFSVLNTFGPVQMDTDAQSKIGYFLTIGIILIVLGFFLSIASITQKGRKRLFSTLSQIISGLIVVIPGLIYLLVILRIL